MLGCLLLLGHGVVALAFVLWGLSFGALGLLLSLPLGGCGCHLSNGPLRPLLMVGVAFCASGLLLLSIFFFFSSFFPFLPVLAASSLSVCVLWSPSCFPCLVSGLPLCLAWSAPPDLFLFLFLFLFVLVLCPCLICLLCGVGGGGGRGGCGGAAGGGGGGGCRRLLAFGVWCMASVYSLAWWWLAFVRLWFVVVGWWWRLLAFGVRPAASVCSLAWWWLACVRLWFWCGWLVFGVFSPLV